LKSDRISELLKKHLSRFAFDRLVAVDAVSGQIEIGLPSDGFAVFKPYIDLSSVFTHNAHDGAEWKKVLKLHDRE
jgi:hypothetical protein